MKIKIKCSKKCFWLPILFDFHPSLPTSVFCILASLSIILLLLCLFSQLIFLQRKKSFLVTFIQSLEKRGCDRLEVLAVSRFIFYIYFTSSIFLLGDFIKSFKTILWCDKRETDICETQTTKTKLTFGVIQRFFRSLAISSSCRQHRRFEW